MSENLTVLAALAIIRDKTGKLQYLYHGAVVPDGMAEPAEIDRLRERGLIGDPQATADTAANTAAAGASTDAGTRPRGRGSRPRAAGTSKQAANKPSTDGADKGDSTATTGAAAGAGKDAPSPGGSGDRQDPGTGS